MKSLSPLARDANEFKNPYKNKRVKNDSRLRTFLSFFLLACVLGMAVRLFFAPERLTPWLREQIAKSLPHGGVQFKSAELQLSNGVLPMLAVEIRDIEIQAKNACAENIPPIRIQNATLPIDIFRLVKGELALSEISVHKIEVDIEDFQQTCAKPSHAEAYQDVGGQNHAPVAGPVSSPHLVPSSSPEPAANELSFWDEKKLLQIGAQVAGIEFDEVKFYFDHHQKYFILKDFNLRQMGPGDYNLKSEFIWPQEHAKGEILPTAFVNAYLNAKKITVEISSQVSEGRLQLRSVILPAAHSPQIETKIQVHQLPVSSFANYLIKMNLLPPQMQPKFVWLNFTALLKGRLDELKHLPIEFNDILLDGEFGQAKVAHMVRNADSSLSEFKIDLTQINVQKSLELFSVKGPDGVFSHFGNFSGQVDFKSPKSFSLSGDLEDSALRFSRHGNRVEQKIDKLSVSLGFSEDHWLCKISDIDLESGEFDGSFDLIFDRNFDQGEIRLMTENLVLNPSVQKTMFDGQVSGMSIAGKLLVSKFLIQSWQGDVEIRSLDSEDLSFKRAKLMSNFKNQKLNIQAKIAEGEYKYNSKMKSWVKKLFLNFEDRNEHLVFTNFKVDLNESENKWDWSNLKASLVDDQVQISGHGDLDAKEQLLAEMSFDFPKAKRLSWKIQGPLSEPSFSPLSNNLKSLISKNADYKNLGLGSNE